MDAAARRKGAAFLFLPCLRRNSKWTRAGTLHRDSVAIL